MKVTLEAARVNSGMTQEKAALLLGISRRSLQKYESYEMSPRVDVAIKMSEIYNCELGDFIFLKQNIALSGKRGVKMK